jgi:hypothetical protein
MRPVTDQQRAGPGTVHPQQRPLSIHRFRPWGALSLGCKFAFYSLMALLLGLLGLGCCAEAVSHSPLDAAILGLFSLCGFVTVPAVLFSALRVFTQTPSAIAVYPRGLLWQRGKRTTLITWREITRVNRFPTALFRAPRVHRNDTLVLVLAAGKSRWVWQELVTDYPALADLAEALHDGATRIRPALPEDPFAGRPRTSPMRCWHCGHPFRVTAPGAPEEVRCPRCGANLGTVGP